MSVEFETRIKQYLDHNGLRESKLRGAVVIIRRSGHYAWVGICELRNNETQILASSGRNPGISRVLIDKAARSQEPLLFRFGWGWECFDYGCKKVRPDDQMIVPIVSPDRIVVGTIHVQGRGHNSLDKDGLIKVQSYGRILADLWK